jgi:sugar fermentation stimulation protein A
MKFNQTLVEGTLLKRYKRFFADVEFIDPATKKKRTLTIHVPNTGSMKSVLAKPVQQQKCWFTLNEDPARKLKGTLQAVQTLDGVWVGVNTSNPNKIVQEAALESIVSGQPFFKHWEKYKFYKSEHKISKETRLDGVFYKKEDDLENKDSKLHYIEIKNTTLMTEIDGVKHAQFPDAVTERGQKHLQELMDLIDEGHQAELIFTIQRDDAKFFSVAKEIDPDYAKLFDKAVKKGLIISPVIVTIDQDSTLLSKKLLVVKSN